VIQSVSSLFGIKLTPQEEQPQLLQPEELQQLAQEQEGMLKIVEEVEVLMMIIVLFVYEE